MKKLLDKWISISLIKRIIGGLALGIILGLLVPKASGIALFGSVFVGALKAIAPLLVFVLVISSLCHSGKSHGGVIKTVIILYMFSTILASVIAVFTSKLFPVTLTLTEGIEEMSSPGSIGDVFNSLLMNIVENPITSLTKANYVGILAWAVVIGIACRHAKESTKDMLVAFPRLLLGLLILLHLVLWDLYLILCQTMVCQYLRNMESFLCFSLVLCCLFISLPTQFLFSGVHTRIPTHLYSDV